MKQYLVDATDNYVVISEVDSWQRYAVTLEELCDYSCPMPPFLTDKLRGDAISRAYAAKALKAGHDYLRYVSEAHVYNDEPKLFREQVSAMLQPVLNDIARYLLKPFS